MPFLALILHWIQPGIHASEGSSELTAGDVKPVAHYGPAGPPPISGPHRYLFILYEQPADFDGTKFGQPADGKQFPMTKRIRYNYEAFVRDAKLGEPLAANWFVSN